MKPIWLILVICGISFIACKEEKAKPVIISDDKANKQWDLVRDPATANDPNNREKTAKIKFKEHSFDFGEIIHGDTVVHDFIFYNTGLSPLWITDAKGSCGCTQPIFPDKPIQAGDSSKISVQFFSAGRKGKQEKSVYIIANTFPTQTELLIYGDVLEKKPKK